MYYRIFVILYIIVLNIVDIIILKGDGAIV